MIFPDTPRHRCQERDTLWHFMFLNTSRSDLRFVECREIPQSRKFHEIAHFTQWEKSYSHPNKMKNRIYLFTVCCPHVWVLAFWILLEVSWRFGEPEFLDMEIRLNKIERLITMYSARKNLRLQQKSSLEFVFQKEIGKVCIRAKWLIRPDLIPVSVAQGD